MAWRRQQPEWVESERVELSSQASDGRTDRRRTGRWRRRRPKRHRDNVSALSVAVTSQTMSRTEDGVDQPSDHRRGRT